MNTSEVKNAVITSTKLGIPHTDHGILSFFIFLEFGGASQGFGGLVLDTYDAAAKRRTPTLLGSSLLLGIGELFEKDWEDLPRTSCRAYGTFSGVKALGHYQKDQWLWFNKNVGLFVVTPFEEIR